VSKKDVETIPAPENNKKNSYLSASVENDSPNGSTFLTCGTNGRLDRIFADGTIENIPINTKADLTQVLIDPNVTLISGRSGTLLYSRDGKVFQNCTGVIKADILGLAVFRGKYYACTSNGSILESGDGVSWKQNAKLGSKAIISIRANDDYIIAITAETDIYISENGTDWDSENFNATYENYYEKYVFTKLECLGISFVVLGYPESDHGYPMIMFSDSGGELWVFNYPEEINDLPLHYYLPLTINALCDYMEDEVMAACNNGRLLALASCSVCNLMMTTPNPDFRAITAGEDKILIVGNDYAYLVLSIEDLRPDKILAEQALEDFEAGALIIDLRDEDEYNQSHVKGCVHIPFGKLASQLREVVPDTNTELIFYCADGAFAQKAFEIAQQLGYHNVYNLGGLSDWPYETE